MMQVRSCSHGPTMTSYERLLAAVNLEDYDRPPFSDNEWNECLPALIPCLAGCRPRTDMQYTEAERAAAIRASMDMVPWHAIYDHRYPVLGPIRPSRDGQSYIDEDGFGHVVHGFSTWIKSRPFADVPGFVAYLERKTAQARRDVPALPAEFTARLEYARRMLGGAVIAIPYMGAELDGLYKLAGWDILAQAVTEQTSVIAEYLDVLADRTVRRIHLYAEHLTAKVCPVAIGAYSDIAHNGGLLLSPAFLRQVLKPVVRKIVAAYHEHGIKVVYHSEGNMRKFLDDLIDAGVDGINPLSPSEHMDPVEIRRQYPRLILWGGIDERAVLAEGSPEDVRREVERVIKGVGRGLILGSSGGVHPACPVENLLAMVDALHSMAG